MLVVAFVVILIGWMLAYAGIRNVSVGSQILSAFGTPTRKPVQ